MGNNIVYVSKVEGNKTLLKFNGLSDTETFDFERKGNDVIIKSDIPNNKGKVTIKDYFKDSNANVFINYNSSDYVANLDNYLNVIPELFYIDKSNAKKLKQLPEQDLMNVLSALIMLIRYILTAEMIPFMQEKVMIKSIFPTDMQPLNTNKVMEMTRFTITETNIQDLIFNFQEVKVNILT